MKPILKINLIIAFIFSALNTISATEGDAEKKTITVQHGLNGYDGMKTVGQLSQSQFSIAVPNNFGTTPNGMALLYFDLDGLIPEIKNKNTQVIVTAAKLTLTVGSQSRPNDNLCLYRVLDDDQKGMWVMGDNTKGGWTAEATNNGVSQLWRDNGHDVPGQDGKPVRPQIPWTDKPGSTILNSLAEKPSSVTFVAELMFRREVVFTGDLLAYDIAHWLSHPEKNQGWALFLETGNSTAGFMGQRAENNTQCPKLEITYTVVPAASSSIVLQEIIPEEDGFVLFWRPYGNMDNYKVKYREEGKEWIAHATNQTSVRLSSADFMYDKTYQFIIEGYSGKTFVKSSEEKSAGIIDNRGLTPDKNGFTLAWSKVYDAHHYKVEYGRESGDAAKNRTTDTTELRVVDDPYFVYGEKYFCKVFAYADAAETQLLRVSVNQFFTSPDQTPPVINYTVHGKESRWPEDYNDKPVKVTIDEIIETESGVAKTEYRLNFDYWKEMNGRELLVNEQGVNRLFFRSTDHAGNVGITETIFVGIDNSPVLFKKPVVKDASGAEVETLLPSDKIMVSVEIVNRSDVSFPAALYVGLFDAADNMLGSVSSGNVIVKSGSTTVSASKKLALPATTDGCFLKIFMFKNKDTNVPINDLVLFPLWLNPVRSHTIMLRNTHSL